MKILLCYNSDNHSNSIVASTIRVLEDSKINNVDKYKNLKNVEIEGFNIDKRNLLKYLEKLSETDELPDAIYVYKSPLVISSRTWTEGLENSCNALRVTYSGLPVLFYDNNVSYKGPYKFGMLPRVRNNKKSYVLIDKIQLDMRNGFEEIPVYKVDIKNLKITMVLKSAFDIEHPKGNMNNCYVTKEEAIRRIEDFLDYKNNIYKDKVQRLEDELKVAKIDLELNKSKIINQSWIHEMDNL